MSKRGRRKPTRLRLGNVSIYQHHGAWWVYYRAGQQKVRRRIGSDRDAALRVASEINGQPTPAGVIPPPQFEAVSLPQLRSEFLNHHEHVLRSSLGTVRRYRAATAHLETYATEAGLQVAHELRAERFVRYLRELRISPNGHPHTRRRPLRDKGLRYILEVSRTLFAFAARRRHLPPYADNPFAAIDIERMRIEDAKPIFCFDAASELKFLHAANGWAFPIHFVLSKTGLRVGELTHLLIEDIDLETGWLHVRNRPALGWRIKTGRERVVPLHPAVASVLRLVIAGRCGGVVFTRPKFDIANVEIAVQSVANWERILGERIAEATDPGSDLRREEHARIARRFWTEVGAVRADAVRISFVRNTRATGLANSTCPKSWRHTFATLLQDANVDPLIRQQTLGHVGAARERGALGMTGVYTHTRPETQRREVLRAIDLWPASLDVAAQFVNGGVR